MKGISTLLASAWMLTSLGATAQVTENFNSRPGTSLYMVKPHLESKCWIFNNFNINDGYTPNIEGDGAMVSTVTTGSTDQSVGIFSQVVDVPGSIQVKFSYKLSDALQAGQTRTIKIFLATADLIPAGAELATITLNQITPVGQTINFDQNFGPVGSGPYRVYWLYQGTGGDTKLAIDKVYLGVPLYYPAGCNSAPVAVADNFNGAANRTASGDVTLNDSDPESEWFDAYLTEQSADGVVELQTNGQFTFTPNPGFNGLTTSFKYRICDFGYTPQCSEEVTVVLTFQATMLPVSLVDFKGLYQDNGEVELSWVTTFESNSDRFEIERSFDGEKWTVVGTQKTGENSAVRKAYSFIDKVGRNTAAKRDIYYRLKQVDLDGRSAYSKLLIVRVYNTQSLKSVSVSPNPAKNDIAVNVQLNEGSFIVMKVLNSAGMEVLRKSAKAGAGSNSYLMDGSSSLKPGMYVLEVTINSKERMVVKLIKE